MHAQAELKAACQARSVTSWRVDLNPRKTTFQALKVGDRLILLCRLINTLHKVKWAFGNPLLDSMACTFS
jgi:hypothetical protein